MVAICTIYTICVHREGPAEGRFGPKKLADHRFSRSGYRALELIVEAYPSERFENVDANCTTVQPAGNRHSKNTGRSIVLNRAGDATNGPPTATSTWSDLPNRPAVLNFKVA